MLAADPDNAANENRPPEPERAEPNRVQALESMSPGVGITEASSQSNSGAESFLERYRRTVQGDNLMAERDDIREEIKDKLATAEAKTEKRIQELEFQFKLGVVDIKNQIGLLSNDVAAIRRDKWTVLATVIGGLLGLAGLIVTLATYGDAMFGRGMSVRDVVHTTIKETLEQSKKTEHPPR